MLNEHWQTKTPAHGRLASVWKTIRNLHMKYYKYICISIMNSLDIKEYSRILSLQETNSLASNEKWHRRSNSNLWIFIIAMYSKLSSMKRPIFYFCCPTWACPARFAEAPCVHPHLATRASSRSARQRGGPRLPKIRRLGLFQQGASNTSDA